MLVDDDELAEDARVAPAARMREATCIQIALAHTFAMA